MRAQTNSHRSGPPWRALTGVGGIGSGLFFALEGNHTLGRNESRPARMRDVRDYCKLHIICHYAAALMRAGASDDSFWVLPVGKVGDDVIGQRLLHEMKQAGMDTRFVESVTGRPTLLSVCFQYPDGSGGNITTSESAASALTMEDVDRAIEAVASTGGSFIALAAPEVPLGIRGHLLERATSCGALRVAAFTTAEIPGALASGMMRFVDLLAMNEDEAETLAGAELDLQAPELFLHKCLEALPGSGSDIRIVVTAGKAGAFATDGRSWDHCPAPEVPVASTAGAGDALLAGVLAGLASSLPFISPGPPRPHSTARTLASALDLGVLLAAFAVTSSHTIHPGVSPASLRAFAAQLGMTLEPELQRVLCIA